MRFARPGVAPSRPVDTRELLGLEQIYMPALKCLDHGGKEVEQTQVLICEAGERDLR